MSNSNILAPQVSFGLDIGGSLAKICVFEPDKTHNWNQYDKNKICLLKSKLKYGTTGIRDKKLEIKLSNGTLHFIHFPTHKYLGAMEIIRNNNLLQKNEAYWGTGGGIHKYGDLVRNTFGVNIRHGDELKCLLRGLNFLLTHLNDECYYMEQQESKQPSAHITDASNVNYNGIFPYILVNIGSGVSILKIKDKSQFERVSGSQIGGGTFWGLCKLFIGNDISYKQAFELTKKGNTQNVNMLVSDIYGGDYSQFNLPGDIIASAFGKCGAMKINELRDLAKNKNDVAKGLLDMIAMNVAQLGYLNAIRFNLKKIIFAGNFLRQNDLSRAIVSWAINYWSKGKMKAYFLKHEGYCGALGVLLAQHQHHHKTNLLPKL